MKLYIYETDVFRLKIYLENGIAIDDDYLTEIPETLLNEYKAAEKAFKEVQDKLYKLKEGVK